jgi:hypothetical protein
MQTGAIQKLLSIDHELRDRTERIQVGLRDEFGPAIATSLLLLEVRERLDHGAFKPYCTLIGIKMRSAQNRLNVGRLARRYGDEQVARLQIGAAQVLGGKSAPKRVVEEIMAEVAAGSPPCLAEVLARLGRKDSRPAKTENMEEAERIARILRDQLTEDAREGVAEFFSTGNSNAVRHVAALLKTLRRGRQAVDAHENAMPGLVC